MKFGGIDGSVCVRARDLSLSASRSPVDFARVGDVGVIGGIDGEWVEGVELNGTEFAPGIEEAAVGVIVLDPSHGWEGFRRYSGEAGFRLSFAWDSNKRCCQIWGTNRERNNSRRARKTALTSQSNDCLIFPFPPS